MNVMYDYDYWFTDNLLKDINKMLTKNFISLGYEDGRYIICRGAKGWNAFDDVDNLCIYLQAMKDGIHIALEGRE